MPPGVVDRMRGGGSRGPRGGEAPFSLDSKKIGGNEDDEEKRYGDAVRFENFK